MSLVEDLTKENKLLKDKIKELNKKIIELEQVEKLVLQYITEKKIDREIKRAKRRNKQNE
jgi:predicted RNase H-like nuclease (RuvC/YqgF family)